MKQPLKFKPAQRLAAIMRTPGGVSVQDALSRASRRVDEARERCIAGLDEKIEDIARKMVDPASVSMQSVYSAASEIYALAGTFDLTELAKAASSLCDLLIAAPSNPKRHDHAMIQSVAVHIDALRTLRRADLSGDKSGRQAVVAGLQRISEKSKSGEGDR